MNRDFAIGLCTAFVCHGVALFAVRAPVTPPRLELASDPGHVEVTLVAAAPEPVAVEEPPAPVVVPMPAPPPPPPVVEPIPPPPPPEIKPKEPEPPPPPKPEPLPPPKPEPEKPAQPTPAEAVPAPPAPAPVKITAPPAAATAETRPAPAAPQLAKAIAPAAPASTPGDAVQLKEPNYRKRARLFYPSEARRQGQDGVVVLSLWIDATGKAGRVEVKQSSGHPLLDEAALNMARRSEYVPARRGSASVASTVEASYRFVLSDRE